MAVTIRLLRRQQPTSNIQHPTSILEQFTLKKFALLIAVVAAAAAIWFYARKPDLPTVPATKVRRETLVSTLPANGKLEPFEWSPVRTESAGIVDRISAQQGQPIAKDAILATRRFTGA